MEKYAVASDSIFLSGNDIQEAVSMTAAHNADMYAADVAKYKFYLKIHSSLIPILFQNYW